MLVGTHCASWCLSKSLKTTPVAASALQWGHGALQAQAKEQQEQAQAQQKVQCESGLLVYVLAHVHHHHMSARNTLNDDLLMSAVFL